jgi:hypothetical protein
MEEALGEEEERETDDAEMRLIDEEERVRSFEANALQHAEQEALRRHTRLAQHARFLTQGAQVCVALLRRVWLGGRERERLE